MFRFLFIVFLLVPLIEIYFLIQVGRVIGAGWTVFMVVSTAVIGTFLIRKQGFSTLQRAQSSMNQGEIPAVEMLEAVVLIFSGAFLLTPGFVTDTLGFLLLLPPLRQALIRYILRNNQLMFRSAGGPQPSHQQATIIEGELVDDDDPHQLR